MADSVFGPHVTGYSALGIQLGATTQVFHDTSTGKSGPDSLNIVLSAPSGAQSQISGVANGQSTTVAVTPGISVTGTVDNARTVPASGQTPELFEFQFTLRAKGSVKVGPFHIPVSAQIDSFDVRIATDPATHAQLVDSSSDGASSDSSSDGASSESSQNDGASSDSSQSDGGDSSS
jgi:hypothetical protein